MIDPKALERLHNSRDFLTYLDEVYSNREVLLRSMYGASNEQLQQKAGCITALNDLLDESGYEELKAKWRKIEA